MEDYLGDGNMAPPEGPMQPDLPTGRSVMYNLDKAGNRTSVTDNVTETPRTHRTTQAVHFGGRKKIRTGSRIPFR